jgi:hypothetical protein
MLGEDIIAVLTQSYQTFKYNLRKKIQVISTLNLAVQ